MRLAIAFIVAALVAILAAPFFLAGLGIAGLMSGANAASRFLYPRPDPYGTDRTQ